MTIWKGREMTLLVAGSAAHLDLILQADRHPAASEVAALHPNPGAEGVWLPGGAARTIALALRGEGLPVRVWYPAADGDAGIETLRLSGVDIAQAPAAAQPVRCVMVYDGERRSAWSTRLLDVAPEQLDTLFDLSLIHI